MTDTFQRTLNTVVMGVRQLEDFAGVLIGDAVEDALLCVARDYGHDYALLLKRYRKDVVGRHASGAVTERTRCRGTTKGNKQCGKRAQIQGYCSTHAAELAAESAKKRQVAAYTSDVRARHVADSNAVLAKLLGTSVCSKPYLVPVLKDNDAFGLV